MTPESEYLLDLAKRNLQPYLTLPHLRAAMVTGSVVLGLSDRYSDIDMMIYFKRLHHFAAQLDRLFTAPPAEAALELKALVDETFDLVAQHMPQVEVASVKQRLNRRRSAWQMPGATE